MSGTIDRNAEIGTTVMTYMNQHTPSPLMTPAEVAKVFAVDPKTVLRWATQGRLPVVRTLGGHRRYSREVVLALAAERYEGDPAAAEKTG